MQNLLKIRKENSQKKSLYLLVILLLCSVSTFSQKIKIDVKTPFQEKKNISHIKQAVLEFIDRSNLFENIEFGEDYSLWLLNYERNIKNGDVFVELDVELRTPAMITRGNLIQKKHISEKISRDEISSSKTDKVSEVIRSKIEQFSSYEKFANQAATQAVLTSLDLSFPIGPIIRSIVSKAESETDTEISDDKVTEAIIVSNEVLIVLASMIPNLEGKIVLPPTNTQRTNKHSGRYEKSDDKYSGETRNEQKISEEGNPKAVGYQKLAWMSYQKGDIEKAIELNEKALQIEKTNGDIKADLGLFYLIKGNENKAMEMYVESVIDFKQKGNSKKALEEAIKKIDEEVSKNKNFNNWELIRDYLQKELNNLEETSSSNKE